MTRYVMPHRADAIRAAARADLHASLQAAQCALRLLLRDRRHPRDRQLLGTALAAVRDAERAAEQLHAPQSLRPRNTLR